MQLISQETINTFLSQYSDEVHTNALKLREVLLKNLLDVQEKPDLPAKMIAYCYGQKYSDLVCTIIPSKKGLKLGFNQGVDLPDPDHLLKGSGKISRYVEINTQEEINSASLKKILKAALLV